MARLVRSYDPRPVSNFQVAPHRYTWNRDEPLNPTYKEFMDWIPYKEGEVVYADFGSGKSIKLLILDVFSYRNSYGERREKYRVCTETKKDHWSKNWQYTYAGFIQRGYKLAGLAPDLET